jgi:hypothetical protein
MQSGLRVPAASFVNIVSARHITNALIVIRPWPIAGERSLETFPRNRGEAKTGAKRLAL